jgi:ABC-2 type transport system permease protein
LTKASGEESVKGLNEIKIGMVHWVPYYDVHNHLWKHGDAQYRGKTSRIVEIIISSIETISIDDGKIIGTSLAGLLQFGQ